MITVKTRNRNFLWYFRIVKILFLLISPLPIQAEQAKPGQEMECAHTSSYDVNIIKEKAISTLVKSDIFKEFSKIYPKNTKFAFPLEMVTVQDTKKCVVQITVYIDENDHYSLVADFLVNGEIPVNISE
ncbi:MAG: hypothetical protein PHI47_07645 [Sulfuricurvum sp.]|uniref:hypothetical protein n=1 Tax=Sulfuricurvum sp. TaxID=2025608 RepID=UPI0026054F0F|nr:hypothetical protein [Sulfuricurvum sp.]MDD5159905.1 hypothetical protein [Sulfuricurvum sp.]